MKRLGLLITILAATTCTAAEGHGDHFHAKHAKEHRAEMREDRALRDGLFSARRTRADRYGIDAEAYDGSSCDAGDVQEVDVSRHEVWNIVATGLVALAQSYLCNSHSSLDAAGSPGEGVRRSQCVRPTPPDGNSPIPNSDFQWSERWQTQHSISDNDDTESQPSPVEDVSMGARERSLGNVAPMDTLPGAQDGGEQTVPPSGLMVGGPGGPTDGVWDIVVQRTDNGDRAVLVWCS